MSRRTPEEVHADGEHDEFVRSCELCQSETTEQATSDHEAPVHTTESEPAEVRTTQAGCVVCGRVEYHRGLCSTHYQSVRGLAR